jgi:uncharacterized protein YndB with AHSA1/START domain
MEKSMQHGNEITVDYMFDAPREQVWKHWTQPELAIKWWGPKNYTSPVCNIDLRVGGKFLNCMKDKEGNEIWGTGIIKEIKPNERLVMTDNFADRNGNIVPPSYYKMEGDFEPEFLITVILEEIKGKTRLTLKHAGLPIGEQSEGAIQGWTESFDKLNRILLMDMYNIHPDLRIEPGKQEVVVTCTFDSPRDKVFKIYNDPKLLPQWWGPRQLTTTVEKMEVKPGGEYRILQYDKDGNEYAFHGVYHEIVPSERVVYTMEYEGVPGHVLLDTVTFEKDTDNRTKMTQKSVFQSVEDRDGMVQNNMEEGMSESMERLAEILARM